jgi:hypothetical protein
MRRRNEIKHDNDYNIHCHYCYQKDINYYLVYKVTNQRGHYLNCDHKNGTFHGTDSYLNRAQTQYGHLHLNQFQIHNFHHWNNHDNYFYHYQ